MLKQQLSEKECEVDYGFACEIPPFFPGTRSNFIKSVELKLFSCHLVLSYPFKIVNRLLKLLSLFWFSVHVLVFTFHIFPWRFCMLDVVSLWESSVFKCGAGKCRCWKGWQRDFPIFYSCLWKVSFLTITSWENGLRFCKLYCRCKLFVSLFFTLGKYFGNGCYAVQPIALGGGWSSTPWRYATLVNKAI